MNSVRVGVQLQPQHCTMDTLRAAWQAADALRVDSIWVWDHFFPLSGDPDGAHFEAWSLLAAMAVDTEHAKLGAMVSCNTYRNPDLLADMARTVDHLSGGRMYLGIGAGWFDHDYTEYGYLFGTPRSRLDDLVVGLDRIAARLVKLNPPPAGTMPILIGASGEKVSLRIVAQYADAWNTYGTPEVYATKNAALDRWCAKLGRDPDEIERTVLITADAIHQWRDYLAAGTQHILVSVENPFDLTPVKLLLTEARENGWGS